MEEFKSESPFEDGDDRSVVFRLHHTEDEQKRNKLVQEHLGSLFNIVNDYIPDFECKITNTIKISDVRFVLSLDNGGIATLETNHNHEFSLVIYSPVDLSIVKKQYLLSIEGSCRYIITKTPMGNLLVALGKTDDINRTNNIYYCNQQGDIIWTKYYLLRHFPVFSLNNDAVIMKTLSGVIIKDLDKETRVDDPSCLFDLNQPGYEVIPYGKKGFICYSMKFIFLFDDNWIGKPVAVREPITMKEPIILNVEIIDENHLIFTTRKALVSVDLVTCEQKVTNLNTFNIAHIYSLNDDFLIFKIAFKHDLTEGIAFYDKKGLRMLPPETSIRTCETMRYVGKMSNNRILLYYPIIETLGIYNMETHEISNYHMDNYSNFIITPTDSILVSDDRGTIYIYS